MYQLTRTLLGSLAGACAALAALAAFTLSEPAVVIDMDVDLPRAVTSGFYPVERTKDETFVWTMPLATMTLRGLDRDVEWSCRARLRGARPKDVPPAQVAIGVDGVTVQTHTAGDVYEDVAATLPIRPGSSSASLTISATPPYVPPSDPRQLGVMLDEVRCEPVAGRVAPPSSVMLAAGVSGAAFGALFSLTLGSGLSIAAAILLVSAGLASLLTTGVASYSRAYLDWIVPVSMFCAGAGAVLTIASWRRRPVHPAGRFVLAFSSAVLCLKVLALLHPSKEVVDAIFQAHRLDSVLNGNYFFTQLMPGGVRFPYAIGLYVTAAPWAGLIPDHVALLRIVVLVAETLAAALLYVAVVRAWGDRLAGAAAVVLYHAAPLSYVVIGNANLTFAFGQSIATIAVTLAVIAGFDRRALLATLGLFVVASLAFLSHVGVFPLVGLTLFGTGLLYAFFGGVELRSSARAVLIASVLAAIFAVAAYYAHFPEVWRTLSSVSSAPQPAGAAVDSAGRSAPAALGVVERATRAARIGVDAYGPWLLLLVPLGGMALRRRRRDRLTLALAGWTISFVVFLAFRVLAPVDAQFQRYADEFIHRVYGMTLPAAAIVTASGAAWAWRQNIAWRIVGGAVTLAAVAAGTYHWASWFR
ncbi:MAG: hypothetical protein M3541_17480 [Acidobacteriota bacterium]|nr:hypothetical protein [Acidobacteriota bacterium]MDQ3420536.1 hypothetical protein [Acidobacteriota bacterium]